MKLVIREEVKNALRKGMPLVALESTIITHGMPYPENVKVAVRVESAVRDNGAIPATIGIINGDIIVGLTTEEINYLGQSKTAIKVSRRDLSYVVFAKRDGGTTVAATMMIAKEAGIKVFVTGGIGGVSRGGNETFDISADLDELSKTNIAVICAGPKAILDLDLTLEYLETKGVPVIGYNTLFMPLFFTMSPTHKVLYNIPSPALLASYITLHNKLALTNGLLVVNPAPSEVIIPYEKMEDVIQKAITEMKKQGIKGKEETPYLLAKVNELTKGKSLATNIALILNNATLGAKIAKEMAKINDENKA